MVIVIIIILAVIARRYEKKTVVKAEMSKPATPAVKPGVAIRKTAVVKKTTKKVPSKKK